MPATVNERSGWNAAVEALEEMAKAMGEKADAARSPNPFDPATMEEADAATSGWVLEQAARLLRERTPEAAPVAVEEADANSGEPIAQTVTNDQIAAVLLQTPNRTLAQDAELRRYLTTPSTPSPQIGKAGAGPVGERGDYLSDTQARELFGLEDDETLDEERIRVCQGEWVRIPGGYYLDKSLGLLHPETANDEACDDCAVSIARPVEKPGEVERQRDWQRAHIVLEAQAREYQTRASAAETALAETRERLEKVDRIRSLGWAVAVHNDYRLNGEAHTFWLFTKDGRAVKGEGRTDAEALTAVLAEIAALTGNAQEARDNETYEIGKRDGYEEAVQHIDERTGGDGEYVAVVGYDGDDRNCPDAPSMVAKIVRRFEAVEHRAETAETALAETRERLEKREEALREIARQKKTDELETEYDAETASFEDGYDLCIDRARAALTGDAQEAGK